MILIWRSVELVWFHCFVFSLETCCHKGNNNVYSKRFRAYHFYGKPKSNHLPICKSMQCIKTIVTKSEKKHSCITISYKNLNRYLLPGEIIHMWVWNLYIMYKVGKVIHTLFAIIYFLTTKVICRGNDYWYQVHVFFSIHIKISSYWDIHYERKKSAFFF